MSDTVTKLLSETGVEVHDDEFAIVSISKDLWPRLLEDQSLSPGGNAPFMIFSDPAEVTLVLNRKDFENIRPSIGDSRFARGFRLVTFTIEMDLTVVGFLAEVTRTLADAGVAVIAVSSFSRDHLLIKQENLAASLKALSGKIPSLC